MMPPLSRRSLLQRLAFAGALLTLPGPLRACSGERNRGPDRDSGPDPDHERLADWTGRVRADGLTSGGVPLGRGAVRVGELAAGTPYVPGTLDAYIGAGSAPPALEPLALSLTRFDCVTLVEACLAVARDARARGEPTWGRFGREVELMRYRQGVRQGYASRLHYFSEWISDGAARGLVRDVGAELGGVEDTRPLRFMTEHRSSYPALTSATVFDEIGVLERSLDGAPRRVVPADRIAERSGQIETGDVLAFRHRDPRAGRDPRRLRLPGPSRHPAGAARSALGWGGRDHPQHAVAIRGRDPALYRSAGGTAAGDGGVTAPLPDGTRRAWTVAYWGLTVAFLVTGFISMYRIRAGFLSNYAADLTCPAWLYIGIRGPHRTNRPSRFGQFFGATPERAALVIFGGSALTELSQIWWPHGFFRGAFDPYDILAYAVGVGVPYLVEKVTTSNRHR